LNGGENDSGDEPEMNSKHSGGMITSGIMQGNNGDEDYDDDDNDDGNEHTLKNGYAGQF